MGSEITAAVDPGPLGRAVALHAVVVPPRLFPRAVVRMQAAAVFAGGVPELEGVWADCIHSMSGVAAPVKDSMFSVKEHEG